MPRLPLDRYETPPHYIHPLLQLIGPFRRRIVYEPCVGRGHLAKHLRGAFLVTNDLDPLCRADTHFDARTEEAWDVQPEWVITNPPFSDELPILQWALKVSRNVAFLARLSFLEPTRSRAAFWAEWPPTDVIVLPRYSFRVNDHRRRQTDNVTCIWLVWRGGRRPCLTFVQPLPPLSRDALALARVCPD